MKILFTGFEPFGGEKTNPSYEAVKQLVNRYEEHKKEFQEKYHLEIIAGELPVTYEGSCKKLDELIETYKPEGIVCVGQAGGRAEITPEYVGINLQNAAIPDNQGVHKVEEAVSEKGETAYFSTFPTMKIAKAIQESGIPAKVSYSAGTYVCNTVLYHILEKTKGTKIKAGFIHVPFSHEQAVGSDKPHLSIEAMTEALLIAAKTIAAERSIL